MVLSVDSLRQELDQVARPELAEPMAAYMKHHFTFLGVKTPARRKASKAVFVAARAADVEHVLAFGAICWDQPEREFQYVGCDVLAREAARLDETHLDRIRVLITDKSWWDTVDALASSVVGSMVRRHPDLSRVMDVWIDADDLWLARTAILHQLRWKSDTDAARLFTYAERRATETDFFIRKAIGWALREYAKTDADAVRRFVEAHADTLSGLTRREALKHL